MALNVPVPWETTLMCYYSPFLLSRHIQRQREKPHIICRLTPALLPLKRTRVTAGHLHYNIAIASTLTFKSLTYHQHYLALKTDKTIGRSNLNAWPWKPHLSRQRWKSQHLIGSEDPTANPKGGDPQVYWQMSISSTQGGRVGIFFTIEQSLLSTARHRSEVLWHWIMVLL